jgi:hypothetical protein
MTRRRLNQPKRPRKNIRVKRCAQPTREIEKCFYFGVVSFAVVLTALLAHGAAFYRLDSAMVVPRRSIEPAPSRNAIYRRAMVLGAQYDSRPYWSAPKLTPGMPASRATADLAIEHLIPCESMGRAVDHLDTNGKMSYGILQFQDWPEWERISGITGSPENSEDAIRMAEWGIENGMIDHWGCASILHMT